MVNFYEGTRNKLFNALGIIYGYIINENCEHILVLCLEDARKEIGNIIKPGLIKDWEAAAIDHQIDATGIAETMAEVFEIVRYRTAPTDYNSLFRLKRCRRKKSCPIPLPHGVIINDERVVANVMTLKMGLEICDEAVWRKTMSTEDAVVVIKGALAANLPVDDEARETLFGQLPEKTRTRFNAASTGTAPTFLSLDAFAHVHRG